MRSRAQAVLALSVLLLALAAGRAAAGTTGAIEGTVMDTSTALPMEGVRITIVSTATDSVRFPLVTDRKGRFYKAGLYAGAYQLTFEKDGYTPQASTVRIKIDDTKTLEVKLQPAGASAGTESAAGPLKKAVELVAAGRYEEALPEAEAAVAQAPSDPFPYYYRAAALERTGKGDAALEDYRKAAELKPDFILPLVRAGMILARKGEFEAAAASYDKAIKQNDQDPATYYNYGVCLVNAGRREEAKAAFEKLLAIDSLYADGLYQLGLVELGLGNAAAAADLLRKFVEMDPANSNATIAGEILKSLK
jgi:tetratricopeptide (TPR) repeat protein